MEGKDRALWDFGILELGNFGIDGHLNKHEISQFPNPQFQNIATLLHTPASLSG